MRTGSDDVPLSALSGSIEIEGKKFEKYYTLLLSSEGDSTGVSVTAAEDNSRFVLIAGEPLRQPVVQMGPFVMNSREGIQQTVMDYQLGRNGFEKSRTWKSQIGGM